MRQTSAAVAAAADRLPGRTSHGVDRLVDREDDIGDTRRVAVMREKISAARPADALDEAAATQFREELFEIGQRGLLALGNLGERYRLAIAVAGEVDHRHDGVAALGAELHEERSAPTLPATS